MNIAQLIEITPDELKTHIIDFRDYKSKKYQCYCTMVLFDVELTDEQKDYFDSCKMVLSHGFTSPQYAPEIRHGFFVVKRR